MKFAIAQVNPTIGDFSLNTGKIIDSIRKARAAGVALVVFPELSVCGYPPRDFLDFPLFAERNLEALSRVAAETAGITAVCGFVEPNPFPTGRPYFNSAAVLSEGKRIATYRKQLLPYYDVFDEPRHFEPGSGACIFSVSAKRVGVTICEDAWNSSGGLARGYAVDPLHDLKGVDLVVNLSASPFCVGRPAERLSLFARAAKSVSAPFLFCNQVGGNDELLFDGCSFAIDERGEVFALGPAFQESLIIGKLGERGGAGLWPGSEGEWLARSLESGLRDYVVKCRGKKVCLGLSGGVDSSVVAVVAARALGPDNVTGVALSTRFTAEASVEDARLLAKNLGIRFQALSVEPLIERFQSIWGEAFGAELKGLSLENIQPRLRMVCLMALANEQGRMLLNTSNKSEIATGYATLYGDTSGALSVLGDLTKAQVYALGRFYNADGVLIPERVFVRPPTAELRDNQTDQDTLPPYDVLDRIVVERVEGYKGPAAMEKEGISAAALTKFSTLHAGSEYKRRQLPPVLRVSRKSFGMGRRMPVAAVPPW